MTTPSSSSLSHALNPSTAIPRSHQELPRLQLAPPEHQKQPHQPRQQQTFQVNPQQQESASRRPTPISSSRDTSPAVGVEYVPNTASAGDKRKNTASNNAQQKKRRTEDDSRSQPYNLGTHYPYAYLYPSGAPAPPALPPYAVPPPPPAPQPPSDMSFNEFQWRLLNLCGEFYEAATELLRATPHAVLSQAFQLLHRGGNGTDPVTILNDARRTCDMLLANPQALAVPPPQPVSLTLPALNSLAHLNARAVVPPMSALPPPAPVTSYYPPPLPPAPMIAPVAPPSAPPPRSASPGKNLSASKPKDKDKASNVQGTWKEHEVERLKALAEKYRTRERPAPQEEEEEEEDVEDAEGVPDDDAAPGNTGNTGSNSAGAKKSNIGEIDWDKVIAEFGDGRSRHQVLIKATYLGLKPSSSLPGKRPKKKKSTPPPIESPAPTFSSASARSIPTGYVSTLPPPLTTTPLVTKVTTPSKVPPNSGTTTTTRATNTTPPGPPLHLPYPQPGWYPQNPYYSYHQPMYYPPQGYNYGPPPQPGYYSQPYASPVVNTSNPDGTGSEKRGVGRPKKGNGTKSATDAPVPPPSLPPKAPATQGTSKSQPPTQGHQSEQGASSTATTPNPNATPITTAATSTTGAVITSSTSTTATSVSVPHSTGGTAGVLRRPAGSTSLFTYTPLPHGPVLTGEGGQ